MAVRLLATLLLLGAIASAPAANPTTATLITTITNPTPAQSANFANAIAALGTDRLIVGSKNANIGAINVGAAYLYTLNGSLQTIITNPTPADGEQFGNAVAALGTDRIVVAAAADTTGANSSGAAYLFGTNGTLLTTFTNPFPAFLARFGSAIASLGPDRLVVGAEYATVGGTFQVGESYLFKSNGALLATFSNPIPQTAGSGFGGSIATVGADLVIFGAPSQPPRAAYLFDTNGVLQTTFSNPTAGTSRFGNAVAGLGTDRVLVGDYFAMNNVGVVYLFGTNGTLLTTFTNPVPSAGEFFGTSMAIVGTDKVLIGVSTNVGGPNLAYLFNTNGTLLTTITNPPNGDLHDASLVAVGTDKFLIGAQYDDTGATDSGTAYLYQLSSGPTQPRLDQTLRSGSNQYRFRITGESNQTYTVQFATALTNWANLLITNTTTNVFFITDPAATNDARIYRVKVN